MFSFHHGSERSEGYLCDLEELTSERYSYNGNTEDQSPNGITDGKRKTAENKPENVQKKGSCPTLISYFFTERVQGNTSKLETLQSDRYPYNGYAPKQTRDDPSERTYQPSQNDPHYIKQYSHERSSLSIIYLICRISSDERIIP